MLARHNRRHLKNSCNRQERRVAEVTLRGIDRDEFTDVCLWDATMHRLLLKTNSKAADVVASWRADSPGHPEQKAAKLERRDAMNGIGKLEPRSVQF